MNLLLELNRAIQSLSETVNSTEQKVQERILEYAVKFANESKDELLIPHVALMHGRSLHFDSNVHPGYVNEYLNSIGHEINLDDPAGKIGIVGLAIIQGATLNVGNIQGHTAYISLDKRIKSQLAVPLKIANTVIGVINLERSTSGAFSSDVQNAIEAMAQSAAFAILNARLIDSIASTNHQVSMITDIPEQSSAVLQDIVERCLKLAVAHAGAIGLLDAIGDVEFIARIEVESLHLQSGEGLTAKAIQTGQPLYIDNVGDHQNYVRNHPRTKSELFVPIKLNDHVIGIINLHSFELNGFNDVTRRLVVLFADQAAVILRQNLFSSALRRLDEMSHKIYSFKNEGQLWRLIQKQVRHIFEYQFHDMDNYKLIRIPRVQMFSVIKFSTNAADDKVEVRVCADDNTIEVFQVDRQSIGQLAYLETGTVFSENPFLGNPTWEAYHSFLAAPIFVRDICRYVVVIHNMVRNGFDTNDLYLLERIAHYVEDALLSLERIRHIGIHVDALNTVDDLILGEDISSEQDIENLYHFTVTPNVTLPIPKSVLKQVIILACKATNSVLGSFFVRNVNKLIKVEPLDNVSEDPFGEIDIQAENSITAKAARTGQLIFERGSNINTRQMNIRSIIAIPIKYNHQVVAVMNVRSEHDNAFDISDKTFLFALGAQLMVAARQADLQLKLYRLVNLSFKMTGVSVNKDEMTLQLLHSALDLLNGEARGLEGFVHKLNIGEDALEYIPDNKYEENSRRNIERISLTLEEPNTVTRKVALTARRKLVKDFDHRRNKYVSMLSGKKAQISVAIYGRYDEAEKDIQANKNRVVRGVLTVVSQHKNGLTSLDFEILTFYSNLIGLFWLYRRQQDRIQALQKIAIEWRNASQWDDLNIWEKLEDLLGGVKVGILTRKYDVGLKLEKEQGATTEYKKEFSIIPLDRGVQGWVASNDCSLNIPDTENKRGIIKPSKGDQELRFMVRDYIKGMTHGDADQPQITRSELAVPMHDRQGEVRGVLNLESPSVFAFDKSDEEFVQVLADLAWDSLDTSFQNQRSWNIGLLAQMLAVSHQRIGPLQKIHQMIESSAKTLEEMSRQHGYSEPERIYALKENIKDFIEEIQENEDTWLEAEQAVEHINPQKTNALELLHKTTDWAIKRCHDTNSSGDETVILASEALYELNFWVDPSIYYVLQNMMNNAFRWRKEKQAQRVELSVRRVDDPFVGKIHIKDFGMGMSAQQCKSVFSPVLSRSAIVMTPRKQRGLGIGLSIAKVIVELHDMGKIEVTSVLNEWTEFSITLPLYLTKAERNKLIAVKKGI